MKNMKIIVLSGLLASAGPLLAQDTLTINRIQAVPEGGDTSLYAGQTVVTGGIVTVGTGIFYMGTGFTFFIEDPGGGPFSGILTYAFQPQGIPDLIPGDSVLCTGVVLDGGMTELTILPGSLRIRPYFSEPGPEVIQAWVIDTSQAPNLHAEQYEAVFTRIYNLTVDSVINSTNTSTWICHDLTGTCLVREASDSIPNSFRPSRGTEFQYIQGVVWQRTGRIYYLQPRYMRDLALPVSGPVIAEVNHYPRFPTPDDTVMVRAMVTDNVSVTEVTLCYGSNGSFECDSMHFHGHYLYEYGLGPFPNNTIVDYYLRALDDEGNKALSPSEAPFSFYSYSVSDTNLGSVGGTITRTENSPVAGARVEAVGTGISDSTDGNGLYLLPGMHQGVYTVSFAHQGYRDTLVPGVAVYALNMTTLDVRMEELCHYVVGDVNGNGVANGGDVIFAVAFYQGHPYPPPYPCNCPPIQFPFFVAGDVNGSCTFDGIDITYMILYFMGRGPDFIPCATCPPGVYVRPVSRQQNTPTFP